MSQDTRSENRFKRECTAGILGGALAGLLAGIATWFYAGSIGEGGLPFAVHAGAAGFVMTLAHTATLYALLGIVMGVIVALVSAALRRTPPRFLTPALTLALTVFGFVYARTFVAGNLSLPAYIPLAHPIRSGLVRPSALNGLAWGLGSLVIGVPVFMGLRSRVFRRSLTALIAVSFVITSVGVVRLNMPRTAREEFVSTSELPDAPGKVMIIGLDGATWQLLDQYSAEGLLPNLDRLRASGTTSNLVTHGRRWSPAVWTGMATGWRHRRHGITGFTVLQTGTGKSRIVRSSDRLKPALWQIASEFERSAVVINWWASYPAEKINGVVVSRVVDMDAPSVYPPELMPVMKAKVDSTGARTAGQGKAITEIETVFDLADEFTGESQPDLLMLYVRATDVAQHIYWGSQEPEEFDETWDITPEYVEEGRQALRDIWSDVDRRVGRLVDRATDDTSILIVSDHGFKPRAVPLVMLNFNALLDAMGYTALAEGSARDVDRTRSRAFSAVTDASQPQLGVFINDVARHEEGIVPPDSVLTLADRLVEDLAAIRVVETGEPIFREVGHVTEEVSAKLAGVGADVYAEKGAAVRIADGGRTIEVAGVERDLLDFLVVHAANTGNHDPRGMLIGVGPAFSERVVLPLVAESPYARALTYVTGYEKKLEGLYSALRGIGILDYFTSIDIAPTILYMLGVPSSSELEGKLMTRLIEPDFLNERPLVLVESFENLRKIGGDEQQEEGTLSEQTLEQLRTLGYLQ